jgi:hypothetical protein
MDEDDRRRSRRIWAAGYFQGLQAKEEPMTPIKLKALLDGQSNIARKVFEVTPIQEAWEPGKIHAAMREVTRSSADLHIVRGCLRALKDAGLVKEPLTNHYQRVEIKSPIPTKEVLPTMATDNTKPAPPAPLTRQPTAQDPLDILAGLATEIAITADEFNGRLKKLAIAVEEAALQIDQRQEEAGKALEVVKQFQALLTKSQA